MTTSTIPPPRIVSRDEWLAERKKLLPEEKELTRHYDRVNAERARMDLDVTDSGLPERQLPNQRLQLHRHRAHERETSLGGSSGVHPRMIRRHPAVQARQRPARLIR